MIKYLEIGVAMGEHAEQVLRDRNIYYTGIDQWKYDTTMEHEKNKIKNWNTQEKWDDIYKSVLKKLSKFEDRASIIRGSSRDVVPTLVHKYDVIYVDGDHSYEGAKKDLELSLEVLAEDGKIIVDDLQYPSVAQAFREFLQENVQLEHKGDTIWRKL
jgi:predicted O-methyltransferase YrrM